MVKTQPKLVIVGASPEETAQLKETLGDRYEIVVQPDESSVAAVLKALGEGVCIVNPEGEVLWSNEYFEQLDESIQSQVNALCVQAADAIPGSMHDTGHGSGAMVTKHRVETDECLRYFDVYITGIARVQGDEIHTGRVAAIVRDVTIAQRTKQKMDAIDRAGFELVRLDVEQIREMNALERLQLLEKRVIKYSHELLRSDHFAIFLADQKTNKLQMVMQSGLPVEIQDLDLYLEAEGSGISGRVATTGESYICYDTLTDDMFLPGLTGARSSLTVPLMVADKIIGIMDIESQQPGAFDDQDRQFAEIFGRYIAMALHMLQLLVTERTATNQTVSGRFEGEINAPLDDIILEVDWLREHQKTSDPETSRHIDRILSDVSSIKDRVRCVSEGPQNLLGVDDALNQREKDPVLVGKRVLVVDDNPKIRKIIGDVLSHRGCETTVVNDGARAIEILEEIKLHGTEPFDLVVSDIQMPDRNGYEVFSAVRRCHPETQVILMTGFGYDPHHSIVRASQEGLKSVLFKPFEIELLMTQVREAFVPDES
ncbi:MAG: response regulator [Phycisphaerales bacterium]|nr:response regulator [Phycisphaerales bacterium]